MKKAKRKIVDEVSAMATGKRKPMKKVSAMAKGRSNSTMAGRTSRGSTSASFALVSLSHGFIPLSFSHLQRNSKLPQQKAMTPFEVGHMKLHGEETKIQRSASSNGLVCFTNTKAIFVFNPSTHDCVTIPPLPLFANILAFYFDPKNQSYKIFMTTNTQDFWCKFELVTGSWKGVRHPPPRTWFPAFVKGAWLLTIGSTGYGICLSDRFHLFIFDMEREEWESVDLPLELQRKEPLSFKLVEWGERVCLIHGFGRSELEIWGLSQEKRWEKLIKMSLGKDCKFNFQELRPAVHCLQMVLQGNSLFIADTIGKTEVEMYVFNVKRCKLNGCLKRNWGSPGLNVLPFTPSRFRCAYSS
ncbi:hypothetical protein AMTR_s00045p00158480 [Amborella trichopoda]|uniref:F-box associated beta-propeller type 3 domain-containing protein n=1 Tax=Amborella trichopoda TaxID=13333 RepID=W1P3D9_AMBTC|nr:hypothetical protein AMTR_s00045p00158480 [Amborella trichopoda]